MSSDPAWSNSTDDELRVLADAASVLARSPGRALPVEEAVWVTSLVMTQWVMLNGQQLKSEARCTGKHPANALNAKRISKLSAPGRYADGNGLYLVVDKSGAKRWVLRTVVRGRRRDMGLGPVRLGTLSVSLERVRAAAKWYRAIARSGGDPFSVRRSERCDPRSVLAKELCLIRFLFRNGYKIEDIGD